MLKIAGFPVSLPYFYNFTLLSWNFDIFLNHLRLPAYLILKVAHFQAIKK